QQRADARGHVLYICVVAEYIASSEVERRPRETRRENLRHDSMGCLSWTPRSERPCNDQGHAERRGTLSHEQSRRCFGRAVDRSWIERRILADEACVTAILETTAHVHEAPCAAACSSCQDIQRAVHVDSDRTVQILFGVVHTVRCAMDHESRRELLEGSIDA